MVCTLYCAHFLVSLFVSSLKLVRFLDCYHSSQKMPMCNKGSYGQLVTNIFRFPHHLISCNKVTNSQVIKLLLLFFFLSVNCNQGELLCETWKSWCWYRMTFSPLACPLMWPASYQIQHHWSTVGKAKSRCQMKPAWNSSLSWYHFCYCF